MRSWSLLLGLVAACGGIRNAPSRTTTPIEGLPLPPPSASTLVPASATTTTWAVDELSLGEAPRSGPPTDVAWRSFGFDLDRFATTKDSTNACTLTEGAPVMNQLDGDFGIDNAWGATLLPLLETVTSLKAPSSALGDALSNGAATLELEVTGLPDDESAGAVGLGLNAFVAGAVGTTPFGAGVSRPVVASSEATFADAYVNAGSFVSGPTASPLLLRLSFQAPLDLVIRDAVVTFDRGDDGSISGTIAGVLDTGALVASAFAFGTAYFPTLCSDASQFDGIAGLIRQAQDILRDGSNRSGAACDGISIGLGFHATRVANPTENVALDPPPVCK